MAVDVILVCIFEFPRRLSLNLETLVLSLVVRCPNQSANDCRKTLRDRFRSQVSGLTNNSHPGMHDSDGHFQVGIV